MRKGVVHSYFQISLSPIRAGLIVDSEYQGISNTLYVNSAEMISKMALLFVETKFIIPFYGRRITSILKICPSTAKVAL